MPESYVDGDNTQLFSIVWVYMFLEQIIQKPSVIL